MGETPSLYNIKIVEITYAMIWCCINAFELNGIDVWRWSITDIWRSTIQNNAVKLKDLKTDCKIMLQHLPSKMLCKSDLQLDESHHPLSGFISFAEYNRLNYCTYFSHSFSNISQTAPGL